MSEPTEKDMERARVVCGCRRCRKLFLWDYPKFCKVHAIAQALANERERALAALRYMMFPASASPRDASMIDMVMVTAMSKVREQDG